MAKEKGIAISFSREQMEMVQSSILRAMQQNNRVFDQVSDCRIHVILKSENQKLKKLHDHIIDNLSHA